MKKYLSPLKKMGKIINTRLGFVLVLLFFYWIKSLWAYSVDFNLDLENTAQTIVAIFNPLPLGLLLLGLPLYFKKRGGASIAAEAGKNLKKSSMELGGNDAFIILDDADWDQLKELLPDVRLYNAGQVCTSSKRFIVLEKDYDKFLEMLVEAFKTAKWGDPMQADTSWLSSRH